MQIEKNKKNKVGNQCNTTTLDRPVNINYEDRYEELTIPVKVKKSTAGYIIGNKGITITKIQNQCYVHISAAQNQSEWATFYITGTRLSICKARWSIIQLENKALTNPRTGQPTQNSIAENQPTTCNPSTNSANVDTKNGQASAGPHNKNHVNKMITPGLQQRITITTRL